jgi:hypothetical protein
MLTHAHTQVGVGGLGGWGRGGDAHGKQQESASRRRQGGGVSRSGREEAVWVPREQGVEGAGFVRACSVMQ